MNRVSLRGELEKNILHNYANNFQYVTGVKFFLASCTQMESVHGLHVIDILMDPYCSLVVCLLLSKLIYGG